MVEHPSPKPTHFRVPKAVRALFRFRRQLFIKPAIDDLSNPSAIATRAQSSLTTPRPLPPIMSSYLGRALMRRPQAVRLCARNASTTSEAANAASSGASKAKDAAGGAASKASEGLSRVTSSGGAAMNKAGAALGNAADALGRVGGRTGRLIGFVQCTF